MPSLPQPPPRKAERLLLVLFLLSLPLLNPWVRGDGVGYYAFARAPLIQHNLDFAPDYQQANASFRENRLDKNGQPFADLRTRTGHLQNHFTVGPAILWAPFLLVAHAGVLLARSLGSAIPADGFSTPYRIAMALGTALCGFLALLISFRLARKYVDEGWALLATLGIWGASSLPVYMYFNPSWSHAHSALVVGLFLWYWDKTHDSRTLLQWILLGAIAGLMLDVYYVNAMLLIVLPFEALREYASAFRKRQPNSPASGSTNMPDTSGVPGVPRITAESSPLRPSLAQLLAWHLVFVVTLLICLLPTFIAHHIIYGSAFETGYISIRQWNWTSPHLMAVLFSSDHGLISWTPILLFALVGLFAFWRSVPRVGAIFLGAALAFYYFIASYPDWAGISSYGNRFFVSLTPLFILGLAVFLERFTRIFRTRRAALAAACIFLACFVFWNAGLMFQWGSHLIPARGPISFPEMIRNQFLVVPRQITSQLETYLFHRKALMQQIEEGDMEQLKKNPPPP
ncbi:MAG TPA: glycosyltransferase family 39 protein [Candidatus Acidoferrum sp.]|nr:glycosyltransferase family 39 protein [Candidatus Acidoferrum sp.]